MQIANPAQQRNKEKTDCSSLHNWWRIRALGFHQETTRSVLYKTLHHIMRLDS